jgi:hypothetical protein
MSVHFAALASWVVTPADAMRRCNPSDVVSQSKDAISRHPYFGKRIRPRACRLLHRRTVCGLVDASSCCECWLTLPDTRRFSLDLQGRGTRNIGACQTETRRPWFSEVPPGTPCTCIVYFESFLPTVGKRHYCLNCSPFVQRLKHETEEPALALGGGLSYCVAARLDPDTTNNGRQKR